MAYQTYDSFANEQNPFVEHLRREEADARNPVKGRQTHPGSDAAPAMDRSKGIPLVEDSENDEGAPNSGYVIHVATEPGKGKVLSSSQ